MSRPTISQRLFNNSLHRATATSISSTSCSLCSRNTILSSSLRSFSSSSVANSSLSPSESSKPGIFGRLKETITEKVMGKFDQRKAKSMDEKFSSFVSEMLKMKKYSLQNHYEFMKKNAEESGATGWKSKLPGVSEQMGIAELKQNIAVMEVIKPEHRANYKLIDREAKINIATLANKSVSDVNFLLQQFEQSVMIHEWLSARKAKNLPIPHNQPEMIKLMRADPPKTPDSIIRKMMQKQKRAARKR
jgi:hypothetical protein